MRPAATAAATSRADSTLAPIASDVPSAVVAGRCEVAVTRRQRAAASARRRSNAQRVSSSGAMTTSPRPPARSASFVLLGPAVRDSERARDDRGVRRRAAALGRDRRDAETLELQDVDRRHLGSDRDLPCEPRIARQRRTAEQSAQQPIGHRLEIGEPQPEALVGHALEDGGHLVENHANRPFRSDAALADQSPRTDGELVAAQDCAVRVDELDADLARLAALARDPRHLRHLGVGALDRLLEAHQLVDEIFGGDVTLDDVDPRREQVRDANRHTDPRPRTVEVHHSPALTGIMSPTARK
jgi:hypothetical protein